MNFQYNIRNCSIKKILIFKNQNKKLKIKKTLLILSKNNLNLVKNNVIKKKMKLKKSNN